MNSLDLVDQKILTILQKNNRITNQKLSELVSISPPSCLRKVKQLHELNYIEQDVAILNPLKFGLNLFAFILVTLKDHGDSSTSEFEDSLQDLLEVMQCSYISGPADYLIQVLIQDMKEYDLFVRQHISSNSLVLRYESIFEMKRIKSSTRLPLKKVFAE
ncbi:MAG: AsnC family transcriptional regulator [SAR324 cluster bacterium]|uniref:AsnC family transcriptional regulator n=1 Tax=SAR324 cluster bacterium TaxID=2024889 RepID=A0A2A4SWF2_9DELT|nr:MAG: AsnC family transcriptional regulator [SAR324 cluster bacterium]